MELKLQKNTKNKYSHIKGKILIKRAESIIN